eukprot:389112_1
MESAEDVIEASALRVNDFVETKIGNGVIRSIVTMNEMFDIDLGGYCANVAIGAIICHRNKNGIQSERGAIFCGDRCDQICMYHKENMTNRMQSERACSSINGAIL